MLSFIGRRLLNYTVMLFAATTLAYFLASSFLNPRTNYLQMRPRPPEASIDVSLNLANVNDKVPVVERYLVWLKKVALHWDWGLSPQGESVNAAIAYRAVVSAKLVLIATLLAVVIGVSLGVASAIRQYRLFDRVSGAVSAFFLVCPTFVLGLVIVLAGIRFNDAVGVRWFYVTGLGDGGFLDYLQHVALPTLTLTLVGYVGYHLTQRTYLLDTMNADYVRTARAKGVPKHLAIRRHALRTSLIPTAMGVVWSLTSVITGAVFTETIFAIDGAGKYFIDALTKNDINGSVAIAAMGGFTTCAGLLLADIVVSMLDPRIRIS
ncbi:MAG TPA: ABC transporter permease [Gammaproteobacteria bacterium]|nr:ABC transporter permease [Gammaproteobacteria bacterium]